MTRIAKCESDNRQFNADGTVVKSYTNDYGLFQINEANIPEAKRLGYDIMTKEGNIKMALYLYKTQGTAPWNSSKHCWSSQ